MMLENTPESPFRNKKIKPINPKGNQPWIFIGRTDAEAEAEALLFWPQDTEELTHWERSWCQEGLSVGGKAGNREWDIV